MTMEKTVVVLSIQCDAKNGQTAGRRLFLLLKIWQFFLKYFLFLQKIFIENKNKIIEETKKLFLRPQTTNVFVLTTQSPSSLNHDCLP